MRENIKLFRTKMTQAGFKLLGHEESPICPVFLKDAVLANQMEKKLMDEQESKVAENNYSVDRLEQMQRQNTSQGVAESIGTNCFPRK
jgi:7-keto-8-aminopelargonate synthetase-like enzyme